MRPVQASIVLLALVALGTPARAGEIEIGGEGYAFTLRDTNVSVLQTYDPSDRSLFSYHEPLRLEGLGWRARGSFSFHDGSERFAIVVQRAPADTHVSLASRFGRFTLEQEERVEAAPGTVDARYERRVTSNERFELRVTGGYRFARVTQSRVITGSCPVCRGLLDARFARLAAESRLTAHGLRAGLSSDVRLPGPLHLESEAGVSLLAGTEKYANNIDYSATLILTGVAVVPALEGIESALRVGPTIEIKRRHSLATWDLSTRLRAEWRGLSASAGYRFERWSQVPALAVGSELGFDGFTFGLGWRFGL